MNALLEEIDDDDDDGGGGGGGDAFSFAFEGPKKRPLNPLPKRADGDLGLETPGDDDEDSDDMYNF